MALLNVGITVTDRTRGPWFHGSPEELSTLRAGSWVTPFKEFAKAFSHKPTRISAFGEDMSIVRHDGRIAGFLYVVAESLADKDLEELAGTEQTHWETKRVLKVRLVAKVPLVESEMLSDAESAEFSKNYSGTGFWSTCREDS